MRVAFLDRDGTINVKAPEGKYIARPSDVQLLPGAAHAIRRLNSHDYTVVVVTNQRGIARGVMSEDQHQQVWAEITARLAEEGAYVAAMHHCPHDVNTCTCRKPMPGLLQRAVDQLPGAALLESVMIGDAASDIEAGRRFGIRTIRISDRPDPHADHTATSLDEAVAWLVTEWDKSRREPGSRSSLRHV